MSVTMDVLVRDGYRCFRCGRSVLNMPHNFHHRLTRSLGPDTMDNLITLCGFGNNLRDADGREWCHGWVHQNSTIARGEGWIISRHTDREPCAIPVRHWDMGMVHITTDGWLLTVEQYERGDANG